MLGWAVITGAAEEGGADGGTVQIFQSGWSLSVSLSPSKVAPIPGMTSHSVLRPSGLYFFRFSGRCLQNKGCGVPQAEMSLG